MTAGDRREDVAMRLGTSIRSAYLVDDVRAGARMMIERARAAEAAGLDSLFVGDHHVTGIPYYQNVPMLGRLLAEWGDRPAGALFLVPMWNPVLLAEQVGTLASLAEGRFVVQCALGDGEAQFAGMGARLAGRVALFEWSLGIVRRLLSGERVDAAGPGGLTIRGAAIGPIPPDPVEFWVGGSAERAIDRAARLGDAWLAGPELGLRDAEDKAAIYLRSCDRHGRRPTAVAIRRDLHVGADDADAERVAGPVLGAGYRGFPPDATVVGGIDTVAREVRRLGSIGYTDVIVRHLAADHSEVLGSLERLAEVRRLVAGV